MKTQSTNMGTMSLLQPENWLYEIWQKGYESPCYVMVPNAKDLVKSHLMIAVREEVEVLKEKISELMDKINQLEVENTILKANMPTETLHQLQMQTQLQITGGVGSAKMIAAPPLQMQQPQQIQQQQQQPQMQQLQQQQQIIPQQQQIIQQQQAPQAFVANPAANFTTGRMS